MQKLNIIYKQDNSFILPSRKIPVNKSGSHSYSFYAISTDNVGNSEITMPKPIVIDAVSGRDGENEFPKKFSLLQNYPNPFNPSTKITFSISKEGKVVLKIYDILGREGTTLLNSGMKAGKHSFLWSPANIASGIYFNRLQSGGFSFVKKMVYLK